MLNTLDFLHLTMLSIKLPAASIPHVFDFDVYNQGTGTDALLYDIMFYEWV